MSGNSFQEAYNDYIPPFISYLPTVSAVGNVQLEVPLPTIPYKVIVFSIKTGGGGSTDNRVTLKHLSGGINYILSATGTNINNDVLFFGVVRSATELHLCSINNAATGLFGSNQIFPYPMSSITVAGGNTGSGTTSDPNVVVMYM